MWRVESSPVLKAQSSSFWFFLRVLALPPNLQDCQQTSDTKFYDARQELQRHMGALQTHCKAVRHWKCFVQRQAADEPLFYNGIELADEALTITVIEQRHSATQCNTKDDMTICIDMYRYVMVWVAGCDLVGIQHRLLSQTEKQSSVSVQLGSMTSLELKGCTSQILRIKWLNTRIRYHVLAMLIRDCSLGVTCSHVCSLNF